MRDLCELCTEVLEKCEDRTGLVKVADAVLEELKTVKGTDIHQYLSIELDVIHMCYVVKLSIPTSSDIFKTVKSDGK